MSLPIGLDDSAIDWTIKVRRAFHRSPELSFHELDTQKRLIEELEELGITANKVAGTGVVARIDGHGDGPCYALRADMDALPVTEEPSEHNKGFISENDGVMHACGHDAHMAMVLATAKVLAEHRSAFRGSVKLIFQPGEELPPGGAIDMVNGGVLDHPTVRGIVALHVFGNIPMNHLYYRPGPIMAGVEDVSITIYGEGGHAAYPHLAIDPILRAAAFISTVQFVVTRDINPLEPTVISFGKITGGTASNIIPDKVELEGTLRALTAETMMKLRKGLRATLDRLAIPLRGDVKRQGYNLSFNAGYPPTVNDPELAKMATKVLGERFARQLNPACEPVMGSEDFAYYALNVPGLFIFFGTQDPSRGITAFNHSPRFAIDERILTTGVEVYLLLLREWLGI